MDLPTVHNLYTMLASTEPDPKVGVRVGHLSGNEQFSLFGAEIAPQKVLSAHYHRSGDEIYLIIEGNGVMSLGDLDSSGNVVWEPSFHISKGDCFTVEAGRVHRLCNHTDQKLLALFGCPKSHLSSDRIIVGER